MLEQRLLWSGSASGLYPDGESILQIFGGRNQFISIKDGELL